MSRGIIIFGASGSGKTTLGKALAQALGYSFYDIDDYIWYWDTPVPYTKMYSKEEKIQRLMQAIKQQPHFVMAGSMTSFHVFFDPFFDLAIYLNAPNDLRLERLHQRELRLFGSRILPGGDMYQEHLRFLDNASRYEYDGSPNYIDHDQWANSLVCPVLRLNGADHIEKNVAQIIETYRNAMIRKV